MNRNLFWFLVAGIIGGFAFAAGSSLETRAEKKLSGLPNSGACVNGAPTTNAPAQGVN